MNRDTFSIIMYRQSHDGSRGEVVAHGFLWSLREDVAELGIAVADKHQGQVCVCTCACDARSWSWARSQSCLFMCTCVMHMHLQLHVCWSCGTDIYIIYMCACIPPCNEEAHYSGTPFRDLKALPFSIKKCFGIWVAFHFRYRNVHTYTHIHKYVYIHVQGLGLAMMCILLGTGRALRINGIEITTVHTWICNT